MQNPSLSIIIQSTLQCLNCLIVECQDVHNLTTDTAQALCESQMTFFEIMNITEAKPWLLTTNQMPVIHCYKLL